MLDSSTHRNTEISECMLRSEGASHFTHTPFLDHFYKPIPSSFLIIEGLLHSWLPTKTEEPHQSKRTNAETDW